MADTDTDFVSANVSWGKLSLADEATRTLVREHVRIPRRRSLAVVRLRSVDASEGIVRAYASTFEPYKIASRTYEVLTPTTFARQRTSVPVFWEHDWKAGPIGTTRSLMADTRGYLVETQLFTDDQRARNITSVSFRGASLSY